MYISIWHAIIGWKLWLFRWSDFYLSRECWYPNVCVCVTIPHEYFQGQLFQQWKASLSSRISNGRKLFATIYTCGLHVEFLGPASSLLALVKTGIPTLFIETSFSIREISVTDSDNYPKRCLAFPTLESGPVISQP